MAKIIRIRPCIDVPLPRHELEEIAEKAKDWALMHGMLFRGKKNFSRDTIPFVPFSLLPSSFPRKEFENACQIQLVLNSLMHAVAHDYNFLKETLQEAVQVDPFTTKLFNIYETVYKEGFGQKLSLGLLRSDLMLESACTDDGCGKVTRAFCCWKQVEINTIASGFGWFGPSTTNLHKFIFQELRLEHELHNLPENNALQELCAGMIRAWELYDDPKYSISIKSLNIFYSHLFYNFLSLNSEEIEVLME